MPRVAALAATAGELDAYAPPSRTMSALTYTSLPSAVLPCS